MTEHSPCYCPPPHTRPPRSGCTSIPLHTLNPYPALPTPTPFPQVGSYVDDDYFYFVMELCSGGDLLTYLSSRGSYRWGTTRTHTHLYARTHAGTFSTLNT